MPGIILNPPKKLTVLLNLIEMGLVIYILMLCAGSCNGGNSSRFDFRTGARMATIISPDTTKPKQIIHEYKLTGSDTLFQILITQVYSPMDVTPRQLDALKQWINSSLKQDTSGIKK